MFVCVRIGASLGLYYLALTHRLGAIVNSSVCLSDLSPILGTPAIGFLCKNRICFGSAADGKLIARQEKRLVRGQVSGHTRCQNLKKKVDIHSVDRLKSWIKSAASRFGRQIDLALGSLAGLCVFPWRVVCADCHCIARTMSAARGNSEL